MTLNDLNDGQTYMMGAIRVQAHNTPAGWRLASVPLGWGEWQIKPDGTIWQSTPALRKKEYQTRWHVVDLSPAA